MEMSGFCPTATMCTSFRRLLLIEQDIYKNNKAKLACITPMFQIIDQLHAIPFCPQEDEETRNREFWQQPFDLNCELMNNTGPWNICEKVQKTRTHPIAIRSGVCWIKNKSTSS